MKTKFILLLLMILSVGVFAQSVEINPGSGSAIITSSATDKGILVPRMTAAQKDAIASPTAGLLIYQTDATTGFYYHNGTGWTNLGGSGGTASELQKITENTKTGWRILGRNAANYGDIGTNSIDLSLSATASTTLGATGTNSISAGDESTASGNVSTAFGSGSKATGSVSTAFGGNTIASGDRSIAMGNGTLASGESSAALNHFTTASGHFATSLGYYSTASGQSSAAIGQYATASGQASVALNLNTTAKSLAETVVGIFNTDYTPLGVTTYNSADRAFGVGIGLHSGGRKDGLIVYKDGTLAFDKLTTAPTTTTDRFYVLNNKLNYNGAEVGAGGGGASELQKITEGANTGWRILGRDPAKFGNIGSEAIDLSSSSVTSTVNGATGQYAIAMGNGTIASNFSSTAMGNSTTASGQNATAMGGGTTASGQYSTAMGLGSIASGYYSTAIGYSTVAKSVYETAIGTWNTDYTPYSEFNSSLSDRAFGVGIGTGLNSKRDGLIVYRDGTLSFDKLTTAPSPTTDRFYILNNKVHYNGAEVGGASELQKLTEGGNTGWRILGRNPANYGNIGDGAIDLSYGPLTSSTRGATATYSTAMGFQTTASTTVSTAMGNSTIASGHSSTAMGNISLASGQTSTAMGTSTIASGISSTAMGALTTASGNNSTAMGEGSTASGLNSTAMGSYSTASGTYSSAIGYATTAKSLSEVTIGQFNDEISGFNASTWTGGKDRVFTVGTGLNLSTKQTAFVIQQNGRVGIGTGTTTITKGLLQIEGFVDYNPNQNVGYLNGGGSVGTFNNTTNTPYSIWASHRIAANEFNAFSDARIKNIVGVSSNTNDLNSLAKIKITDYTMKDKIQYGNKTYKKVIAQELKEVYPQAVNISSNIIPNIYQKATAANGWIALNTDLEKGDVVRIVMANNSREYSVEEVTEGKFKVATPDGEVFVYGKEVSDFHTVDYEALSTLNISATQALLKRIEELEAKNASLTSQVKEMASLKNDIEAIKASLGFGTKTTVSSK